MTGVDQTDVRCLPKMSKILKQARFLFDTHDSPHLSSSQGNTKLFCLSPQVNKILISVLLFFLPTFQPVLSHFLHFLAIIIMEFAKILEQVKSHQRPLPIQRCRSIKRCDTSMSPGPKFRGFFCHCFSWYGRCL